MECSHHFSPCLGENFARNWGRNFGKNLERNFAESKENLMDPRPRCTQCGQRFPHETALHQHHIDAHDAYLQQVIGTGQDGPGIRKAVHDVLGGTLTGTRLNPGPYNALLAANRLSYPSALFDECDPVPQRNISVPTRDEALLPAWKLPARSTIRKCDPQINFVAERMCERMLCVVLVCLLSSPSPCVCPF